MTILGDAAWLPVPPGLRQQFGDRHWDLAWQYRGHSVVYRLSRPHDADIFLKLVPAHHYPNPTGEAMRMRWARAFLPVPDVLGCGTEDGTDWLATGALDGSDGTAPHHVGEPARLVRCLATALRAFHDSAPVAACPFDFRLDAALSHVRSRIAAGLVDPARDFHPEHLHFSAQEAARFLETSRPKTEDLVVCHGDYCPPNILFENWSLTGFVDLGELGVADRWWDLATATWSLTWNLGPGLEELFLSEYGVEPDPDRRDYYRMMYDLVC
jgi:kanamycin kinase